MPRALLLLLLAASLLPATTAPGQGPSYHNFESGQVRPLALSPDGTQLFAVNTPDNRLEIFDVEPGGLLTRAGSVQVGMEPVAVAARSNDEVWVVNHLSDSVSVVRLDGGAPRVVRTFLVGDEPNDVVFAGPTDTNGFRKRGFVTTAHRGQNSPFPRSEYATAGVGRADVWVFDATLPGASLGGDPLSVITLFGDKPRALATSNDGSQVYAAVFHSGNRTAALNDVYVCDTSATNLANDVVEPSCTVAGATSPGGYPPPHNNQQAVARPETGLILKFDRDGGTSGQWQDEVDVGVCAGGPDDGAECTSNDDCRGSGVCTGLAPRSWNDLVKFDLPDRDVFVIDANATPPAALDGSSICDVTPSVDPECWAGVGTTLFNMAVNPISGKIYVSNTDAQNHVRFEGPGTLAAAVKPAGEPATVQGNLAQSRITVLDGITVLPRHLNKHISYGTLPAPAGIKEKSVATPLGMAVTPDGQTLYVAAFGSRRVGVFDTGLLESDGFVPSATDHIPLGGPGGPSGLALRGTRLYVLTRFDNAVRVLDRVGKTEDQVLALHTPEPPDTVAGRPFLYDALLTSSNGEASCSSCHVFGDLDDLAWDLGNPDDNVATNDNDINPAIPPEFDPLCFPNNDPNCTRSFHPMKGPMTTQSLRGLLHMGAEHWRGDRQGDGIPGNDGSDEILAFEAFNVAFPGLVGRDAMLGAAEMTAFRKFALEIRYPPNPIRQLENALRPDEILGFNLFTGRITDTVTNCVGCHALSAVDGHFGGDGESIFDGSTQHFKVPHLRNLYQKIGMFGAADPGGALVDPPFTHQGDQVRGFGFSHDGSVDTLFRFVSAALFSVDPDEQADIEAYMVAFDTDLAPIVGQQVTLTDTNSGVANPRVDRLVAQAATGFTSKILGGAVTECDLVAKLVEGGVERGYRRQTDGSFQPDDGGTAISEGTLRDKAMLPGQEVTFTCTPPGSGTRMGIDRDEDALHDGVETNTRVFVSALDTGSDPANADTDGDGFDDGVEVAAGRDPNDPLDFPGGPVTGVPAGSWVSLVALAGALWLLAARTLAGGVARSRR